MPNQKKGGLIASVRERSLARRWGLRPGDRLLGINGQPLRDIIDYRFLCAEEKTVLEIEQEGKIRQLTLTKDWAEELGIEFSSPVFDGIKECPNHCFFCYVKGLPPQVRPSLGIKDDDYRYSFLFGNFITLANITEEDWQRLAQQRLSPLYVSIHSTDLNLRRRMLGNLRVPDILQQLNRLEQLKIRVHAQVVLCPGVNDGDNLAKTVADLAAFYPTVQSLAIVPVGLTKYQKVSPESSPQGLHPVTPQRARSIIAQATPWQKHYRRIIGVNFVYLADEFYLMAGQEPPSTKSYDGFPQFQNGVGMARALLDEWKKEKKRLASCREKLLNGKPIAFTLVCGTLISPFLSRIVAELNTLGNITAKVIAVENRFFGPTVTVSGLLTGRDVINSLRGQHLGDVVILPRTMLDAAGEVFLDNTTPAEVEQELGHQIAFAFSLREVIDLAWRSEVV